MKEQKSIDKINESMQEKPSTVPVMLSMCQSGSLLRAQSSAKQDPDEPPRSYIKMRNWPCKFVASMIEQMQTEFDVTELLKDISQTKQVF